MAKTRKDETQWNRFRRWTEENQKVVMVLLLLLIAPLFAFTTPVAQKLAPGTEDPLLTVVYGDEVTRSEVVAMNDRLVRARTVVQLARASAGFGDFPAGRILDLFPQAEGYGRSSLMNLDGLYYHIYREKALREGLRVSDEELGEHVRELWQGLRAGELAAEELENKRDPKKKRDQQEAFQLQIEAMQLAMAKKDELAARGEFDRDSWVDLVLRITSRGERRVVRIADFEETLRDLYLIAKLEDRVKSWVQVTSEEAYEQYRKDKQTRMLSWTELALNDALKEKVAKNITPEAVKDHYASFQAGAGQPENPFERPASLRVEWLLLPKAQFEEEAKKKITDADLRDYYEKNRNDFRKPAVLGTEAQFAPRSEEESRKFAESLYRPFEEVRDQVAEKVVAQNSRVEMTSFSAHLRSRLHPPKPASGEAPRPATFAEIVKDFPYLKAGTSGWVSREDAKAALGEAYAADAFNSWFGQIENPRGGRPDFQVREEGHVVDAGKAFYRKPETRQAGVPSFRDVEGDVRTHLIKEKALALIEKAAASASDDLNAGKTDLDKVAASGLEVPAPTSAAADAPVENVHVAAAPIERSRRHVGSKESLMLLRKEDAKEDANKEKEKQKEKDEAEEPAEEAHPSSEAIVAAAFKVQEEGKTAVTKDMKRGSVYIVRHDGVIQADAAGFEAARKSIEGGVRQERLVTRFTTWREQVFEEARGGRPAPDRATPDNEEEKPPTP